MISTDLNISKELFKLVYDRFNIIQNFHMFIEFRQLKMCESQGLWRTYKYIIQYLCSVEPKIIRHKIPKNIDNKIFKSIIFKKDWFT